MHLDLEVRQVAEHEYRVIDVRTSILAKGRFHTRSEAEDWILRQRAKNVLDVIGAAPRGSMPGRARAFLLTDPIFAGQNESLVRRVLTSLIHSAVSSTG